MQPVEQAQKACMQCMGEIPLSASVVQQTIALRSKYPVKLPDAVIASTALTAGLKLMTRNQTDFERIEGLVIINPFVSHA